MFQFPPPPDPAPAVAEVVVTARLPPPEGEAAFSAIRLEAPALLREPRLDEALRQVPGVSLFRRTGSLGANPTIQGLSLRAIAPSGAGRALVTLDGVPQNDPFGGWVIWTALPPGSIESATVLRGAGAGSYGAGALTGVVALDERSSGTAAELAVGDRGFARAAGAGVASTTRFRLFGSLSADTFGGWIPVRAGGGPVDEPLDLSSWSAAGRFQTEVGRAVLAARVSAYDEDRGTGVAGGRAFANGTAASLALAAPPTTETAGWRLQGWIRESDFGQVSLAVNRERTTARPAASQDQTPATGFGFNAALRGRGYGVSWEFGGDARFAEGETRERFRNLGRGFTRSRVAGGRTSVIGVYAEATRSAAPWLLTGGLRLDRWTSSDAVRLERDIASGERTLEDRSPDRDGVVASARVGLRRDFAHGAFWRAAAYSGFRPPTLNELHRPFRVGNDVTEANAALEPERLYGLDAGVGAERAQFSWSFGVFLNRLEDAITNVTIGAGPGVFPRAGFIPRAGSLRERRNAGTVDAVGIEAEAERRLGESLSLRAALAFVEAETGAGLRPAQAPRSTVTAGGVWIPASHWEIAADVRYEGERFEDDLNTRRLSPAVVLDARVSRGLTGRLRAFLAVENLFDAPVETQESGAGLESFGPPRLVRLGLSLR